MIRFLKVLAALALAGPLLVLGLGSGVAGASVAPAARPAAVNYNSCEFRIPNFGERYYEADKSRGLDWWPRDNANSGSPLVLQPVSSGSSLDCFHVEGGFGGSKLEFQLNHSSLCLNIAGNSHAVGAWVILWPCISASNEMFKLNAAGTNDGAESISSASSGLCIDMGNGYHAGSILEQKICEFGDIYQAWIVAG